MQDYAVKSISVRLYVCTVPPSVVRITLKVLYVFLWILLGRRILGTTPIVWNMSGRINPDQRIVGGIIGSCISLDETVLLNSCLKMKWTIRSCSMRAILRLSELFSSVYIYSYCLSQSCAH